MLAVALIVASGALLGFVFAMPIAGPVSALLWSRVLSGQTKNGALLGMGSAIAEGTYAGVAALLVGKTLTHLTPLMHWAQAIGALVLIGVGLLLLTRKPNTAAAVSVRHGDFALGFVLSAANPALLVSWTGAITTLHALGFVALTAADAIPFGLGAALGLASWYLTVTVVVRRNQTLLTPARVERVLKILGIIVIAIGVVVALQFLWQHL